MDVSKQFNAFAGREVTVTEHDISDLYKKLGIDVAPGEAVEARLNDGDPAVKELSDAVKKAGLTLRLWLPDSMGTMDYRLDRVNVYVKKEADGKYRIQPEMNLG